MTTKLQVQERVAGIHRELDALAREAGRSRGLQLAARALRQAESTAQWVQVLADAAAPFAAAVAFFRVADDRLLCEAVRGRELATANVSLAEAPAFRQAVETKETVVSLFLPSQLGAYGLPGSRRRAHLFPLVGKTRTLGVLLALDDEGPDTYALEVLLSLGSAALELRSTASTGFVGVSPVAAVLAIPTAQRFARTTVAGWILDQPERVAAGRAKADLYGEMGGAIDAARAVYAVRYPPHPDHLHMEMVERLALGTAAWMGSGYNGGTNGS